MNSALLCQCGSSDFLTGKLKKTSVEVICSQCGEKTAVKGQVAIDGEVLKPTEKDERKVEEPKEIEDYEVFRFRVSKDAARSIKLAMLCIRVINKDNTEFDGIKKWMGPALEYMAVEFLNGIPHQIISYAHMLLDQLDEQSSALGRVLTKKEADNFVKSKIDELKEQKEDE